MGSQNRQPTSSLGKRKTSKKTSSYTIRREQNRSSKVIYSNEVELEVGDNLHYDSHIYTLEEHVSSGRYGKVFRVQLKNQSANESLACKIQPEQFEDESNIHRMLSHKHIVKFFESFRSDRYCFIFMEYCKNGTLRELVHAREGLTVFESRYFFHQIMLGIQYVHKMKIIHRDLKLDNILLATNMQIKIGDFGLAKPANALQQIRNQIEQNRNHYKAPELFNGKRYTTASDIWATGVILYKMVFNRGPFHIDEDFMAATQYKFDFELENNDDLYNVLTDIFQPKYLRLDAKQCLAAEFLYNHKIPKKLPESIRTEPVHEITNDPSYEF